MAARFRNFLVAGLTVLHYGALAVTPQNITAGELSRLPEYCPDTIAFELRGSRDGPTPRQRRWAGMMGEPFWALHHYCWALVSANRADAAGVSPTERRYLLIAAVNDAYYVVKLSSPAFPLLPEILTRIGQWHARAGNPVEALGHFDQARQLKIDYWPPYLGIADLNLSLGRRDAAIEALRAGLRAMPDEPRLKDALARAEQDRSLPSKRAKPATSADKQ